MTDQEVVDEIHRVVGRLRTLVSIARTKGLAVRMDVAHAEEFGTPVGPTPLLSVWISRHIQPKPGVETPIAPKRESHQKGTVE